MGPDDPHDYSDCVRFHYIDCNKEIAHAIIRAMAKILGCDPDDPECQQQCAEYLQSISFDSDHV